MIAHLLQSTAFAAVVGLVTVAFRHNHARTRHALWLAASLKFLIPFSAFISLGTQIHWRKPITAPPQFTFVMTQQPVAPAERAAQSPKPLPAPPPTPTNPIPYLWALGTLALTLRWLLSWRTHSCVPRRDSSRRMAGNDIPILLIPTLTEPAVHGIFRPILLIPEAITDRLTPDELRAVIAHELCHVRHRDNLAAAVHMLVEALFWFHPLVWYIGARLVDERERACDEEVLASGNSPHSYAEAILKVCRFCLESPLPCASGITGADLHSRIETILTPRAMPCLHAAKKLLLASLAALSIATPFAIGLLNAPPSHAQERTVPPVAFEVASIKHPDENGRFSLSLSPHRSGGRITWTTTRTLALLWAFHLQTWRVTGIEPDDNFLQFDATTDPNASTDQLRLMMQRLLIDRFKLASHRETRELSGFALVIGKNGPKIKPASDAEKPAPLPEWFASRGESLSQAIEGQILNTMEGKGIAAVTGRRVTMTALAETLQDIVHAFVIDKTGMIGKYYFGFKCIRPDLAIDADAPTVFESLQESLGLKLEKQNGPVDMLVVDHMEKEPTGN